MAYHKRKHDRSPITLEELIELGRVAHGRTVWNHTAIGPGQLVFDWPTKQVMTCDKFKALQRERADIRRRNYPDGRRRGRRRYTAVLGFEKCGAAL